MYVRIYCSHVCLPCCQWVLSNPRGTFVLVFPEKIKVCQVDVVRIGMRAGEGLRPLGGQVAASPGSASQPAQAAPHPTHPCTRAPSPLCPSLRGPGLGVKQQPQGHMAGEDAGVGAQVSLASPGLSHPCPARKASFQEATSTGTVRRVHTVKPWAFCTTRAWEEVLGTQDGRQSGCTLHPQP